MAPSLVCSVEHCDKPLHLRRLCNSHYKRLLRHGDPLAGGTPWGHARKWVEQVAIPFTGDECLQFPFSRNDYGYGKIRGPEGKNVGVHVLVCAAKHGPKPSPRHEACHSCGKGHEGCANPNHLYWGTRKQNMADAMRHGTLKNKKPWWLRGERHGNAKFSDALIEEVKKMLDEGLMTQKEISARTGISQGHISRISLGQCRASGLGVFA